MSYMPVYDINSSKMNRRKIICVVFGMMTLPAVAQTDSVSKNVQLKEVVVAGDMRNERWTISTVFLLRNSGNMLIPDLSL